MPRTVCGALLPCVALLLLGGCVHHRGDLECREPPFAGNAQSLAPLRAPPGLNAPDTAGGVRIPVLSGSEPLQARNSPCLDWPPKYVSEPPIPPTRRPSP